MAQFQAFEAFNINTIDLNWFLATYEAEVMTENPLGGYEDLYVVYTFFDQALVMAGHWFDYDNHGAPTIGIIEAFGEARETADGVWVDVFWATDLHLWMRDVYEAIWTHTNDDDIALMRAQLSGRDEIHLSEQRDVMNGFSGNDRLYGHGGNDTLLGGGGKDKLYGGEGKDRLSGGSGNDVIRGGRGNDKEIGGAGADTFVFRSGDDKAFILDFDATSANHDVIDLSNLVAVRTWTDLTRNHMEQVGDDVRIDAGRGDLIVIRNTDMADLDRGDFIF